MGATRRVRLQATEEMLIMYNVQIVERRRYIQDKEARQGHISMHTGKMDNTANDKTKMQR